MVPMHGTNDVGALPEPPVRSPGFSRSGPPEGGTPNKLRPTGRFKVPMDSEKRKGAFHVPPPDASQEEQAFTRVLSVPLPGEVRGGFGVPKIIARRKER